MAVSGKQEPLGLLRPARGGCVINYIYFTGPTRHRAHTQRKIPHKRRDSAN